MQQVDLYNDLKIKKENFMSILNHLNKQELLDYIIITYLRTTMSQERLSNIAIINFNNIVIDLDDILTEFKKKDRKLEL